MTKSKKRPGRPILTDKLSPAQKQSAYRARQRSRIDALEVNHLHTCDVYEDQKKHIEFLESEFARLNGFIKEYVDFCGLYAAVLPRESWVCRAKAMFDKSGNVTKIYKQVDIED